MTLTATIHHEHDTPWLYITSHATRGAPICVYDAPLNLSTKTTTKAEIDYAHEKTGLSRADLYDAVRTHNRGENRRHQAA